MSASFVSDHLRHPLQELVVDSFVTNSTLIGGMDQNAITAPNAATDASEASHPSETGNTHVENRVIIITGPNSSGKSVYLKQVRVCSY